MIKIDIHRPWRLTYDVCNGYSIRNSENEFVVRGGHSIYNEKEFAFIVKCVNEYEGDDSSSSNFPKLDSEGLKGANAVGRAQMIKAFKKSPV